jgi:dUTP pyrophosphatase
MNLFQGMRRTVVRVQQLSHGEGLPLPSYQTEGSAGMDLIAALDEEETLFLPAGERALVPTGLALEIPHGYEGQIRPRSGIALTYGVTVLNSPGTIDSDYRGEVRVMLVNLGLETFAIERGARVAQLVIAPVTRVTLEATDELVGSERGAGGFGSTGV